MLINKTFKHEFLSNHGADLKTKICFRILVVRSMQWSYNMKGILNVEKLIFFMIR